MTRYFPHTRRSSRIQSSRLSSMVVTQISFAVTSLFGLFGSVCWPAVGIIVLPHEPLHGCRCPHQPGIEMGDLLVGANAERGAGDVKGVLQGRAYQVAFRRVPHPGLMVLARRDQAPAVRAERNVSDERPGRVQQRRGDGFARGRVPHPGDSHAAYRGRHPAAVGAKGDVGHRPGVPDLQGERAARSYVTARSAASPMMAEAATPCLSR